METTTTCWKEVGGTRKNGFIGYKDILRQFGGFKENQVVKVCNYCY